MGLYRQNMVFRETKILKESKRDTSEDRVWALSWNIFLYWNRTWQTKAPRLILIK